MSFVEPLRDALGKALVTITVDGRSVSTAEDLSLLEFRNLLALRDLSTRLRHMFDALRWRDGNQVNLSLVSLADFLEAFDTESLPPPKNFGKKSMKELREILFDFGLRLGMSREEYRSVVASGNHPELKR
jgi:hypothetical protein